jgi:uncharacterized protein
MSPQPPSERCVLLFARPAAAEARSKRLAGARRLFDLARRRVAAAVSALPGVSLVVVGPGGDLPQRGEGFAERLANAFEDARALGCREIVAVPADVPGLGARQLAEAFRRLHGAPVVLGPSPDGGVYLLGCRVDAAAQAPLLAGVRWQTARVFGDLASNAGRVEVLEPLRDVDHRADLALLLAEGGLDRELAELIARLLRRGPAAPPVDAPAIPRLLLAAARTGRAPPPAALPAF